MVCWPFPTLLLNGVYNESWQTRGGEREREEWKLIIHFPLSLWNLWLIITLYRCFNLSIQRSQVSDGCLISITERINTGTSISSEETLTFDLHFNLEHIILCVLTIHCKAFRMHLLTVFLKANFINDKRRAPWHVICENIGIRYLASQVITSLQPPHSIYMWAKQ